MPNSGAYVSPIRSLLAVILATQLTIPVCLAAQDPVAAAPKAGAQDAKAAPPQAMVAGALKILILEGNGALNSVDMRNAIPPVVEIRDQDDRPVEAASVVFRLPASGPGGTFNNQQLSKTAITNVHGQATSGPWVPNSTLGRFQIHVTATSGNRMGEADIVQTNTARQLAMSGEPEKPKKSHWKWIAIGAGAAALTVGIVLLVHHSSSGSSTPTVAINPGPVTIGQ
jgi:hypothetical protein